MNSDLAERAVQLLVSNRCFSFDGNARGVSVVQWNPSKTMGVLPSSLPAKGELAVVKESGIPHLKHVHTTDADYYWCAQSRLAAHYVLHINRSLHYNTIHLMKNRANFLMVSEMPNVPVKNCPSLFQHNLRLLQRKIVWWCFSYFNTNSNRDPISMNTLQRHFPFLLAMSFTELKSFVEKAVVEYAEGLLIVFDESIILQMRSKQNVVFPPLNSREKENLKSFEKKLLHCWLCFHVPLSEVLHSLHVVSTKVLSSGYAVASSVVSRCLCIVLSVLRSFVAGLSSDENLWTTNLYLLSMRCNLGASNLFHFDDRTQYAEDLLKVALCERSHAVSEVEVGGGFGVSSFFSQPPEDPNEKKLSCLRLSKRTLASEISVADGERQLPTEKPMDAVVLFRSLDHTIFRQVLQEFVTEDTFSSLELIIGKRNRQTEEMDEDLWISSRKKRKG